MIFTRILVVALISFILILPVMAADASDQLNSAGALYSKSVDLANAGNYSEALALSDEALAMNVTSLVPLIQANRAGILVMLGRFEEAGAAADVALNTEGNLTTVHSIAWYNKGNALRSLGRLDEAKTAYAKAYALDKSLVPPDLSQATIIPTTPAKSPLVWITVPVAVTLVTLIFGLRYGRRK
jgi:tetratricopeptide (TPR) repeat protein